MKVIVAPDSLTGHPDLEAMLQAFYSRSHKSIEDRLETLGTDADAIRASLEKFYIAYAHESIGDCGHMTVFIEGVSFLTAKAIQDHPLYNGQETSSRYIDFSQQEVPDYADEEYLYWMALYRDAVPMLLASMEERMPDAAGGAIKSAAFDVARGLLPAGALTQLSWHSSIRVLREHLGHLLAHPFTVVRQDAAQILDVLSKVMPHMFKDVVAVPGYEWFLDSNKNRNLGLNASPLWKHIREDNQTHMVLAGTGVVRLNLDYGSYRDLQRHRNCYIKSTAPNTDIGPDRWYLAELPELIAAEVKSQWAYSTPEPTNVPLLSVVSTVVAATVPQFAYMMNLRSKTTVHPTMRKYAQTSIEMITGNYPNLSFLFKPDLRPSDYERRGTQTILKDGREID